MRNLLIIILAIISIPTIVNASNLFWIGGMGNWNDTIHWSYSSNGPSCGCVPNQVDNVFFDQYSFPLGGSVSINQQAYCRDMTWASVTNFPTLAGAFELDIYGSLTFSNSMNLTYTGDMYFKSNVTTASITTAGRIIRSNIYFDGTGGSWMLQDSLVTYGVGTTLYHNNGSLNTNGQYLYLNKLISTGNGVRTLDLGASTITLTSNSYSTPYQALYLTGSNYIVNAGTSHFILTGSPGYFVGGNGLFYNLTFTSSTSAGYILGSPTFNDVVFSNDANYGSVVFNNVIVRGNGNISGNCTYDSLTLSVGKTYTFSGATTQTFVSSLTAIGACYNPLELLCTSGFATFLKASGTVNIDYIRLKNIHATGGAAFVANNVSDFGNNTGWVLNQAVPKTLFWIGNSGNWSDPNHWSISSGGSSSGCIPSIYDDVVFDNNSFSGGGQSVMIDKTSYCRDMTWASVTNFPTLAGAFELDIYGSLTFSNSMNLTYTGDMYFKSNVTTASITTAGRIIRSNIYFDGTGGSWMLQDSLVTYGVGTTLYHNNGSLNTNGQYLYLNKLISTGNGVRTLDLGASTITLTSNSYSTPYQALYLTGSNYIVNAGTSHFILTGSPGYFVGGNGLFYNLTFTSSTSAGYILGSPTFNDVVFSNDANYGSMNFNNVVIGGNGTIGGSCTYNNLSLAAGKAYTFNNSTTQTFNGDLNAFGTSALPITIYSTTGFAVFFKANGTVCNDWLILNNIHTSGAASFYAGANSVNQGNNTGWLFSSCVGCIPVSVVNTLLNQSSPVGSTVTWNVILGGTAPYTYQWYKNGVQIAGATSNSYTTPVLTMVDNGNTYYCYVTNCSGGSNAISNVATLSITTVLNQFTFLNQLPYDVYPFSNPCTLATGFTDALAPIVKICADGSQATKLRYINNDGSVNSANIRFWIASDPFGNHVDTTGYFINYNVVGNIITATYAHPHYLSAYNLPYKADTIYVIDISNSATPKYKIPIEIYRAPVLFVHGLYGDATTFASMATSLKNNNYYPGDLEYVVNYKRTSLQAFAANIDEVPNGIYRLFHQTLTSKYSAGKVDIVAHSMGGILSRLYLQSNYGYVYKNDINKLITLNTPHSGSHFAKWAAFNPINLAACGISLLFFQNSIFCNGAGVDLPTNSYAIDKVLNDPISLNYGHVPSHTFSTYISNSDIANCVSPIVLGVLVVNAVTVPIIFGLGQQMDGVVRQDSQEGGLIGLSTTSNIYQCHIGAANNAFIQAEVSQLLCSDPSGGQFALTGFNPPDLRMGYSIPNSLILKSYVNRTHINSQNAFVDIVSPASGSSYVPNQLVTISIDSDTSIDRLVVLAGNASIGVTYYDSTNLFTTTNFTYAIPATAVGQLEVDAIGFDSLGNILAYDSITFNVNAIATLDSIRIVPKIILVPTSMQSNYEIIGYYSDSIQRDITSLIGMQYSIVDVGVCENVSPGVLEGIGIDSTRLIASYNGVMDTALVLVYSGDSLSQSLFSSNTNSVCDSGHVVFYDLSTGHPLSIEWHFPGGVPAISTDSIPIVYYNSAGNYDVSLIATYDNRVDTLTLPGYITVDSEPLSTLVFDNDTIFCSYEDGIFYQWYHNNVTIDSSYLFYILPDSSGTYFVTVMSAAGCIANSDTLYIASTNVIYTGENNNIIVFPNPTNDILNIKGWGLEDVKCRVALSNVYGQIVEVEDIVINKNVFVTEIDMTSLLSGIYILTLESNRIIRTFKIQKQ